jgi:hypothetical protein
VSTAAVLFARIRHRERVIDNIVTRNPDTYRDNPYYAQLQSAVVAYRDALQQLERVTASEDAIAFA